MLRIIAAKTLALLVGVFIFTGSAFASDVTVASWYGDKYHGRRTASGEIFNARALTAAHPTLPLGSVVEVRRLDNGRAVQVRINDRCGRCGIDLSRAAADHLRMRGDGRATVSVSPVTRVAWAD
ncbi:septal ring lytic transglycosylase RlpA family protein [Magnetospirillum sulfuroxidans]|uniref:Endolytic peptidoglycan transglycosylase RlpA n=1 Tax=Magnetospirillum sulfuroxidans TaxID=611300 RepID=A0ABS5IGU6_9PROT|nr:septal ring lytic transglycosylase RlpA family protein [Magnetospirillum sulfuroxidans]MBR9972918.1 septal ring lytic transglycosylase RlpA family protein [Magnetospirillum sulfuroxidans]